MRTSHRERRALNIEEKRGWNEERTCKKDFARDCIECQEIRKNEEKEKNSE